MAQNIKFKVKQFEWFQMQTKVRQIIQEIINPMQKRIMQTSSTLNKVKVSQIQDQQKIQEMTLMIANDPKVFQTGVFGLVDKKFQQQAKLIQQLCRQISQENKYVQNKFKILDIRMEQSSQVLKNIASLKQRITRQMEIQNDNIFQIRTNIQKMIEDLNNDLRQTRQNIVQNAELNQKSIYCIEEQIRRIKSNISTIDDNLNLHRDMHRQKTLQLEDHTRIIEQHNQDIKDLFANKHLTKRLGDLVQDMQNDIKKTIFKVQAIAPLITQAQISECLTAILPPKLKNKISIYEHKKYYQYNKQVLQKDFVKISQKFKGLQLLQHMQKKCTKQIVQLKRKKLLEMGVDIDHATYEQRERYYNQVSLDDQLNSDLQEKKVAQKVDQAQIKRIMDHFMKDYMASFKQQMKVQIQHNKKYIYAVQDQIKYQVANFQKSMTSVRNQCAAFHTEQLLELKSVNSNAKSINENNQSLKQKLKQAQDLQRLFYNFCSLINHLSIQDQIDKQNISLLGAKQINSDDISQNRERNSVVSIDDRCFSCNGYPATTLSAFKMACLAYHPSPIKIDSKEYKRQELLQFTTGMLQNIKKSIQTNTKNLNHYQSASHTDPNQTQPALRSISLQIKTLQQQQKKNSFKNSFISRNLQTEANPVEERIKSLSNTKFRKAKKVLNTTVSTNYYTNTKSMKKAIRDDMLSTTTIFNSLKKKNQQYLA